MEDLMLKIENFNFFNMNFIVIYQNRVTLKSYLKYFKHCHNFHSSMLKLRTETLVGCRRKLSLKLSDVN